MTHSLKEMLEEQVCQPIPKEQVYLGNTLAGYELWKVTNTSNGAWIYWTGEGADFDSSLWDYESLKLVLQDMKKNRGSFIRRLGYWMKYSRARKIWWIKKFLHLV
jgi:hypothetical protein